MKVYGYSKKEQGAEDITPAELAEVTLVASPDELRRIAKFLESCASGIEARGKSWAHEHLSDKYKNFGNFPQFIVCNLGASCDLEQCFKSLTLFAGTSEAGRLA